MTTHPFPINLIGRRVLVVEDDTVTAKALVWIFELCGAEIIGPAPTMEHALELIRNYDRLDGAVLDASLRGSPSCAIADILKNRGVPFVINTGYNRDELPNQLQQAPYCQKPVRPGEIIAALFPGGNPS
jgi:CheY-like chemotaxis protein